MPWSATIVAAEAILLFPLLALAFAGDLFAQAVNRLPTPARVALPGLAVIPYYLVTHSTGDFHWSFAGLYAILPILLVGLLWYAAKVDPQQRGSWPDFVVLAVLGLVVEFRLFEPAWPGHLRAFNRLILLDTGLYGFLVIRQLTNVGFHFVPQWQDVKTGLRELAFYAPIAAPLGLGLGFLHFHADLPSPWNFALSWISIFAFIAVLEETTSADGCKICWNAGSAGAGRCSPRLRCLACRTSIKARRTSTGVMCCWRRWREFSTAGPGDRDIAWWRPPLPTRQWTRYGCSGCDEPGHDARGSENSQVQLASGGVLRWEP